MMKNRKISRLFLSLLKPNFTVKRGVNKTSLLIHNLWEISKASIIGNLLIYTNFIQMGLEIDTGLVVDR